MTKTQIQKHLSGLFVSVEKNDGAKVLCYADEYMDKNNAEQYAVHNAVSDVMRESGLSHDFSYEVASRAVDILADLEHWDNEEMGAQNDEITEAVDGAVPIYTHDLMTIYSDDVWAVDEAVEEMGDGGDSTKRAQMGWYVLIRNTVYNIKRGLDELLADEDEITQIIAHKKRA